MGEEPLGASDVPAPRRMLHAISATVLAIGILLTTGLALAAWSVHSNNEDRLLRQRTREAGALLTVALPSVEAPLGAAALTAETTNADPGPFTRLLKPLVGARPRPFVSASIWSVDAGEGDPRPLVVYGDQPRLASAPPAEIRAFLARSTSTPKLSVIDFLQSGRPRLGYSMAVTDEPARYVVYAEAELPANRLSAVPDDNAFSGLDFAIYLGRREEEAHLVSATTPDLPLGGRTSSEDVPFGDTYLHLVVAPQGELGGGLLAFLPWLVAIVGFGMTLGSTGLTERLLRGREHAERLAVENEALYRRQRTVAVTLQHSLLPSRLPDVPGLDLSARYESGTAGLEVGGDWYDVVVLSDDRLLFVVGDVSGRGLPAATMMGSLRSMVEAYAAQGDPPGTILSKLARLVSVERDHQFATVVCGVVDVPTHRLTVANAGHPQPLVVADGTASALAIPVGPPIGVVRDAVYREHALTVPDGATLLAFTDGLFERRNESVDVGLGRLRASAAACAVGPLDDVLSELLVRLVPQGAEDDTAVLGIRWVEDGGSAPPLEPEPDVPMGAT